ncbi:uncharacterized protein cubi_01709 [Cryptosporidium ubiquitum]|uniref:Uncharacterized protein n=1 Tax=Cryptosporidium ubiquitum TaxID=857276 RepID=A0A1J4MAI4_9CRYT|nr:uncharacterized protein cubi_01709 [Cryptosporidium ubiquitum]OII71234.1 hypothetical protein cubi_01709 [Cryptosporidium ubiquitum]
MTNSKNNDDNEKIQVKEIEESTVQTTNSTRTADIWNLYGMIDADPISSTESDDIQYVSMVAIGAATSAALWKAYFYRPEEMDDFTTYSMYIVTVLTIVGAFYVISSMRKREREEKLKSLKSSQSSSSDNNSDDSKKNKETTINDEDNKVSSNNMRRRKNRAD